MANYAIDSCASINSFYLVTMSNIMIINEISAVGKDFVLFLSPKVIKVHILPPHCSYFLLACRFNKLYFCTMASYSNDGRYPDNRHDWKASKQASSATQVINRFYQLLMLPKISRSNLIKRGIRHPNFISQSEMVLHNQNSSLRLLNKSQ